MRRLDDVFDVALDRRLAPGAAPPLAVALSGGSDSLALLILTLDWARRHGRAVLALVFDHGINPASGEWTAFALAAARRLGASARALDWAGEKPAAGLAAAARSARHAALAAAAREAGAGVLLMGHTADDRIEAAAMRASGSTVPDPRPWAPSPAWPEGRGVFILRPLLDVRRAELRDLLRRRGESWIDDPANADPTSLRARVRAGQGRDSAVQPLGEQPAADIDGWQERFGALETQGGVDPAALAPACLCAAGTARPPAREQMSRLLALVDDGGDFAATLAGARVQRRDGRLTVSREAGRLASPAMALSAAPMVWDGRFEVCGEGTVRSLGGLAARLPKPQRDALAGVPVPARPSLPVVVDAHGNASCPVLAEGANGALATSLVMTRFAAACGQVSREMA